MAMTEEKNAAAEKYFAGPFDNQKYMLPTDMETDLWEEVKRLRAENESLKIEFAGIDCEHRAKVMAELLEENERLEKALREFCGA